MPLPTHEERCTNARKLIGSFNLIQLFGEDGNGGVPLHTILKTGVNNLAANSPEKAGAEAMVAALDQSPRMLYRHFFIEEKARWPCPQDQKDGISNTFISAPNQTVFDHFALPHAQHIRQPNADRMTRMAELITVLLEDDGAGICTPLRLLTLNAMETHINYNVRQFCLMKVARNEGLLTEDPRRRVVAGTKEDGNNKCASFDTELLLWNCDTDEPGAKCTIINGVPSLLSNICD